MTSDLHTIRESLLVCFCHYECPRWYLQSQMSVSTNLVLTVRKAVSLGLSVYFWGGIWNIQLSLGAALVFSGSFLYSVA